MVFTTAESNGHADKGSLKLIGVGCDVASEISVQKAFKETFDEFGRIDAVVASAGIVENYSAFECVPTSYQFLASSAAAVMQTSVHVLMEFSSLSSFSYPFDRIKRLYDINVHGAFFTAREAARRMIPDGGGSIVLVASMSAQVRILV